MGCSRADDGAMGQCLAGHAVVLQVAGHDRFECGVEMSIPEKIVLSIRELEQVGAHIAERRLDMLEALLHDVLKLDVAQSLGEAGDAFSVVGFHVRDDGEQEFAVACEFLLHSLQVADEADDETARFVTFKGCSGGGKLAFNPGAGGADPFGDIGCGLGGEDGQLAHFIGDDGESATGTAGAGGFNLRVQGEKVGLLRDGGDDFDQGREGRDFAGETLDALQVRAEVLVFFLQLAFDRADHFLVVGDPRLRAG